MGYKDKQIADALRVARRATKEREPAPYFDPNAPRRIKNGVLNPNIDDPDYAENVNRWREQRGAYGREKPYDPWSDKENMYTHPTQERHAPDDPQYHVSPEEFKRGALGRKVYALKDGGRAEIENALRLAFGGRAGMATGGDPTDAYLSSLYQNVMGRQADPEGQSFWRQKLNEGSMGQADVLHSFAQSPEFQNLYKANPSQAVSALYHTALGRAPDQAGLDFWTQQAQKGLDLGQMVSGFTGSEEGQTVRDINQLYQNYAGNIATPEQIQSAREALGAGDWRSLIEKTFPVRDTSEEYDVASNKGGWKSIATPVPQSSEDLQAHFGPLEKQYNLPPGTLLGMMGAESTYGANQLNSMGYKGAFQFGGDAIREYNRAHPDAPLTSKNIYDWKKAADAAAWYAAQNAGRFREKTGRDPLANELYNMHQQGFGGYTTIAANPKMKAVDALDKIMGRGKAIASIKHNLPPSLQGKVSFQDVTGEQFVEGWRESYKDKFKGPDDSGVEAIAKYYGIQPSVVLAGGAGTDKSTGVERGLVGEVTTAPTTAPAPPPESPPGMGDYDQAMNDYRQAHANWMAQANSWSPFGSIPESIRAAEPQPPNPADYGNPSGGIYRPAPPAPAPSLQPINHHPAPHHPAPHHPAPHHPAPHHPGHGVDSTLHVLSGEGAGQSLSYHVPANHVPYNHIAHPGAGGFNHGHHGSSHHGGHGSHGYWDPNWANSSMHSGGDQSFFKSGGRVERADGGDVMKDSQIEDALRIARKSGGGAWTRKEGKSESGGLNEKGRASLRAQGHDIKRPQPEGGPRRDSFCARMKGMKAKLTSSETANDPDSRINKSLRKWNCADGGAIEDALRLAKGGNIWDKSRPKSLGKPDTLSKSQKRSAKASAKAAGRPYPNLVDNMRAAQRKK